MHLICVKIINHKKHLYYFIEFSTRTKPYIFTHVVTISCAFVSSYLRLLLLPPSHSVTSDSVRPHRLQPTRLPRPWDSPGKSAGVGCHRLLRLCLHLVLFSLYPRENLTTPEGRGPPNLHPPCSSWPTYSRLLVPKQKRHKSWNPV